jgi:predicted ester cyclase
VGMRADQGRTGQARHQGLGLGGSERSFDDMGSGRHHDAAVRVGRSSCAARPAGSWRPTSSPSRPSGSARPRKRSSASTTRGWRPGTGTMPKRSRNCSATNDVALPEPITTKDGVRQYAQRWFTAFPDMSVKQMNRVVSDDAVAAEVSVHGHQHRSHEMAGKEIPPTGRAWWARARTSCALRAARSSSSTPTPTSRA